MSNTRAGTHAHNFHRAQPNAFASLYTSLALLVRFTYLSAIAQNLTQLYMSALHSEMTYFRICRQTDASYLSIRIAEPHKCTSIYRCGYQDLLARD